MVSIIINAIIVFIASGIMGVICYNKGRKDGYISGLAYGQAIGLRDGAKAVTR